MTQLTAEQEVWIRAWCAAVDPHYATPATTAEYAVVEFNKRFPQPQTDPEAERYARIGREVLDIYRKFYGSGKADLWFISEIASIMTEHGIVEELEKLFDTRAGR